MKPEHTICFVFLFCCISPFLLASSPAEENTYDTENRMFYIERSKNKNIVCYDFNLNDNGVLNETDPLSVYWINREEHPGQQGSLNYIQRKMAFGYAVAGKNNGNVVIEINALKNRKLTMQQKEQKYFCQTDINKQPATLYKIYVKTKDSNSLQVEYVDIFGYSHATGSLVTERIIP